MNKDDMISILNQHGIDALHAAIEDELGKAFDVGYDVGYDECYYTAEQATKEKQQSTYDPLMDREYNI